MKNHTKAAEKVIKEKIANPLGMTLIEAADGILRIAATTMSYAVKGVSTERGLDAASFTMVAMGGAGPLHATQVAREIGMKKIIVPESPGHFSAFGMLFSDLRYDFVQTCPSRLSDVAFDDLEQIYQNMESAGHTAIDRTSINVSKREVARAADMRYVGQEHAVTVDLSVNYFDQKDKEGIKAEFDRVHKIRYGTSAPAEQAEIVSLRSAVTGQMQKPPIKKHLGKSGKIPLEAKTGARQIYFSNGNGFIDTPSFSRNKLLAGNQIIGPAVIEEYASTTVLFPDDSLEVDGYGNLIITVGKVLI